MAVNISNDDVANTLGVPGDYTTSIECAELEVNECLADSGYTEERQEKIGVLLAAHFETLSNSNLHQIKSEKIGDNSTTYAIPNGTESGYKATTYGEQALTLDKDGCLINSGKVSFYIDAIRLTEDCY